MRIIFKMKGEARKIVITVKLHHVQAIKAHLKKMGARKIRIKRLA